MPPGVAPQLSNQSDDAGGLFDESTTERHQEVAEEPAEYPEGEIPLTDGEPSTAEEVAELVAFLLSDRARHITGTPVWIDGAESLLLG